jgi:hypothetical protein
MPTQATPFLEGMIRFLLPYFLALIPDPAAARAEIIETLASYGARTRAEALNAVQVIAFSLTTLDTLAEAKETEMSQSMRLRYRGCANNLNRSTQRNEAILAKRQAADPPPSPDPMVEPIDDLSEAATREALQQVQEEIRLYRNGLSSAHPLTTPHARPLTPADELNIAAFSNAMVSALTRDKSAAGPPAPT